jgi:electron transfer flavoprotein alpha subunit
MRVSGVADDFRRAVNSRRYVVFLCIQFGAALCLLLPAGCSKAVRPGATYNVWILAKGNDGKAAPQGSATRVESAAVQNVQEISNEGQTLLLVVRKTQYGKATFDIIFPDKTTQRVQVKAGEPKDLLPRGQKIGARIEILDSH